MAFVTGVWSGNNGARPAPRISSRHSQSFRVSIFAVSDEPGDDNGLRPPPKMRDVLREDEDEMLLGLDDDLTEDERVLEKPRDPTDLRTESERRRSVPVNSKLRRRRRQLQNEMSSDLIKDWDKLETRPLVKPTADPKTGEDYWIDFTLKKDPGKKRRMKQVDGKLKERLKKETASPYKNNWIGIIVVVVLALVILYNILPNQSPIIPLPDL